MKKAYAKTGRVCRVTFAVQPEDHVQSVAVCGEFNGWDPAAHHMKRQKNGRFTVTLSLPAGISMATTCFTRRARIFCGGSDAQRMLPPAIPERLRSRPTTASAASSSAGCALRGRTTRTSRDNESNDADVRKRFAGYESAFRCRLRARMAAMPVPRSITVAGSGTAAVGST